jgi:hypothetical protein
MISVSLIFEKVELVLKGMAFRPYVNGTRYGAALAAEEFLPGQPSPSG